MLNPYFVDAWLFIALTDRRDTDYLRARRVTQRVGQARLVTHAAVFFELLAFFSEEGSQARAQAVANVRDAMLSMEVITPDRALFLGALDRYAARPDKKYSLTDCMSMIVMEERGIRHVLTNDHHFRQEGFVVVNE